MTNPSQRNDVKYAAFFRNLNLGRPNCPNRVQLEASFISAGADVATSFLTNGTVVFVAKSDAHAAKILSRARQTLQEECGLKEPAFVRSVGYLVELVALDPFAAIARDQVYECCVSFLHADSSIMPASLPLESKRRDLEIFRVTRSEALSVSRKIGNSPGSPNAFLEKLLGLPVTTRSWNTVQRLVRKHG